VVIAVTPATATLEVGGTREFTAQVTNTTNTAVSWTSSGGAISGSGNTVTWTAPATAGTYSVTATSAADATKQASASVTVTPPASTVVVLDNAPIGPSGGTVTVDRDGSPLDGLRVILPQGAFAGTTSWTVTELREVRPVFPAGLTQVGPGIRIRNGQGFAEHPFIVQLPVRVGPGQVAAAMMRDPESGRLEVLPLIHRTDTSVSVLTQHLSANQMLLPASAGGLGASGGVSGAPTAGEVEVFTVAAALADLNGTLTTNFLPGRDDWEFANNGSVLTPGGYCTGATLSAIHHLYARTAQRGTLSGLYDSVSTHEYDNPRGVRLASVIQRDSRAETAAALQRQELDQYVLTSGGTLLTNATSWVEMQLTNLAVAMKAGGPQLLAIMPDIGTGHALVAYQMTWLTQSGLVGVSDPNYPGATNRAIQFQQHVITPYDGSDRQGGAPKEYTRLFHLGISALMPLGQLDGLWQAFDAGTIGDGRFPDMIAEYLDPVGTVWRPLTDTVETASDGLTFRTRCPNCPKFRPNGSNPADRALTSIWTDQGSALGQDLSDAAEGLEMTVQDGTHRYGLGQFALKFHPTEDEWVYSNFDWTRVKKVPFDLTADPEEPLPGQTVTLTVDNDELGDATMKYRWTFDGGAPEFTAFATPTLDKVMPVDPLTVRVELVDKDNHPVARKEIVVTPVEFEVTLAASPALVNRDGTSNVKVTLTPAYSGNDLAYRFLSAETQGELSPPSGTWSSNTSVQYRADRWAAGGTETVRVEVLLIENNAIKDIVGEDDVTIEVNPYHAGSYGVIEPTLNCVAPFIFIPKVVGATTYEVIADGFNHPTLGTMYTTTFSGPTGGTAVFDVQETGADFRIRMEGGGCAISDLARQAMANAMNARFAGIKVRVKASP